MSHRESQQRYVLFWLSTSYIALSRLHLDALVGRRVHPDNEQNATQVAVRKTVSLVHRLVWFFSVLYVTTLEFGKLYCGGETIMAFYLRKFAQFLTNHEKYRLASRMVSVAVSWNELWLGSKSAAIKDSYRQSAVLNSLAGKSWWPIVRKI